MAKSNIFFRWLMWKRYFDTGMGLTNYAKYLIAFLGVAGLGVKNTLILAVVWAIFCFIVGKLWFKYKIVELDYEISNIFNPFQRQVRKSLKLKSFSKA
jgi:hypothetical protein